ncbi:MAG: DUF5985 family protein [Acidobacteriota bacterium]
MKPLFLKCWYETQEHLFAIFAISFWVLALNQLGFGLLNPSRDAVSYLYIVQLIAFILILVAIVDKNRSKK